MNLNYLKFFKLIYYIMNKFVEKAMEQALKSPMADKYGAVLVYRNRIISSGFNYYTWKFPKKKYSVLCS